MISKSDLEAAYCAGAGDPLMFREELRRQAEGWMRWWFVCQDCGQDTSEEPTNIHLCPVRFPHPYRHAAPRYPEYPEPYRHANCMPGACSASCMMTP